MAANDDLRFVYEQARRFVSARPWERLAHGSLYLDLKVGSWQEACAQHFSNDSVSALFLFPGHQNLLDLQRAGMAPDDDGMVPLMGMPRPDLYGDADCTLSFTTISWPEYWALRARAPVCRPAKLPFEERGELIPVMTISGSRDHALEIAQKLT